MISYVSVSDLEKIILSNKTVDMIDIEIVDENNNYVNFRGIDWSITLCLSVEKNDIVKFDYGLYNLPPSLVQNTENKNNIVKLSRDEKDLKLLES